MCCPETPREVRAASRDTTGPRASFVEVKSGWGHSCSSDKRGSEQDEPAMSPAAFESFWLGVRPRRQGADWQSACRLTTCPTALPSAKMDCEL